MEKRYWLVASRAMIGLKQKEVAEAVGVSQGEYSQYENGLRNPKIKTAKKIAEFLGFEWVKFYEEAA